MTMTERTYPQDFSTWRQLIPLDELEELIGRDAMDILISKFEEENTPLEL